MDRLKAMDTAQELLARLMLGWRRLYEDGDTRDLGDVVKCCGRRTEGVSATSGAECPMVATLLRTEHGMYECTVQLQDDTKVVSDSCSDYRAALYQALWRVLVELRDEEAVK